MVSHAAFLFLALDFFSEAALPAARQASHFFVGVVKIMRVPQPAEQWPSFGYAPWKFSAGFPMLGIG